MWQGSPRLSCRNGRGSARARRQIWRACLWQGSFPSRRMRRCLRQGPLYSRGESACF